MEKPFNNYVEEVSKNFAVGFLGLIDMHNEPYVIRLMSELLEKFADFQSIVDHFQSLMMNDCKFAHAIYKSSKVDSSAWKLANNFLRWNLLKYAQVSVISKAYSKNYMCAYLW